MNLIAKEHSPEIKCLLEKLKNDGVDIQQVPCLDIGEVEALYSEIKEFIGGNYQGEYGDVSNSLAEYAMIVLNVRRGKIAKNAIFVTKNFSLILNREKLTEKYGIPILSLDEMMERVKKGGKKK